MDDREQLMDVPDVRAQSFVRCNRLLIGLAIAFAVVLIVVVALAITILARRSQTVDEPAEKKTSDGAKDPTVVEVVGMNTNVSNKSSMVIPDIPTGNSKAIVPNDVVKPEASGVQQAVVCDGDELDLSCSAGKTLIARSVIYGRASADICPDPNLPANVKCRALPRFTNKLADLIKGKHTISQTLDSAFYETDPCPKISKYTTIEYECI